MNVLKGVASGVSGAASSVANTASKIRSGKRGKLSQDGSCIEDQILANALPTVSMSVKSSPSKDSVTTRHLSVKNGELQKRNEQGGWHRVQACLVPHWYLYYFENEFSESPRGVIDLQLYSKTNISGNASEDFQVDTKALKRENKVLKLSSEALGAGVKDMYFGAEEEETLREWVAVIQRDRYEAIRDERNAYVALQEQFSGELEKVNKSKEMSDASKEDLVRQIAAIQTAHDDLSVAMQRVLSLFGSTEEDMRRVQGDGRKCSELCAQYFKRLLRDQETAKSEAQSKLENERAVYARKIEELELKLEEAGKGMHAAREASKLGEERGKEAVELLRLEVHQAQVNLNAQVALRQEEEERTSKLNEEKRVLVKEVKTLRKKLESSELKLAQVDDTVENMMTLNDQLNSSVRDLTTQKQTLWERMQAMEQQQGEYLRRYQDYNRTSLSISTSNSAALYAEGKASPVSEDTEIGAAGAGPGAGKSEGEGVEVEEGEGEGSVDDHELWQEGVPREQSTTDRRDLEAEGEGEDGEGEGECEGEDGEGTWRSSISGDIAALDDRALVEAALRGPLPAVSSPGHAGGVAPEEQSEGENGSPPPESESESEQAESRGGSFEMMTGLRLQELSWRSQEPGGRDQPGPSREPSQSSTGASRGSSGGGGGGRSMSMSMDIAAIDISEVAEFASKSASGAVSLASKIMSYDPHKAGGSAGAGKGGGDPLVHGEGGSEEGDGSLLRLSDSEVPPPAPAAASIGQFYASPVDYDDHDANNDSAKAIKVHCLRCGGTVEGPKHSTCTCKQPMIADLSSSQGQQINEQAPDSGARWDRRKEEAKAKAGRMSKRLSSGMTSMGVSMSRAAASFSASLSSTSASASTSTSTSAAAGGQGDGVMGGREGEGDGGESALPGTEAEDGHRLEL